MACDLKKHYPKLSSSDIGILLDVCTTSATRYLKDGSKGGLCDYEVGENEVTILYKGSSVPVGVYKDGNLVKRYDSVIQMIELSEQDFGVKFSQAFRGYVKKGKEYKGFIIKKEEKIELSINDKKLLLINHHGIDLDKFNINVKVD